MPYVHLVLAADAPLNRHKVWYTLQRYAQYARYFNYNYRVKIEEQNMALETLNVVVAPDPTLRQVCEDCVVGDKSLVDLAEKMANTMYANNGCGIAAPQVGVLKRIIVIDCDQDSGEQNPIVLVNPVILETKGRIRTEKEGCLSCPGISVPISRREYAKVKYFDLDGEEWIIEGDELLGRCLQHEIDHLNGKTLFESCSLGDRIIALSDYKYATAAGAKPGEVGA